MNASKQSCKNHPDKFTSKRCYNCKSHICTECQRHHFHHIFCSIKCMLIWRIKDFTSVFKISREFTWYIILLLMSNIILYNLIISRIETTHPKIPDSMDSTAVYPAAHDFIMDSVRYAVKGKFKIEINAVDNVVLSLSHNGKFVETLLPDEKSFSFEDVNLAPGNNTFLIWALSAAGKTTLLDSFTLTYKAPRIGYLQQPLYRFNTTKKAIALTFDGGASNKGTSKILDILRQQNIKSTMFLTGQFIENFPNLVAQLLRDGHEVGNHSYNHPHFTNVEIDGTPVSRNYVSRSWFEKQINVTDSLFHVSFGKRMMPYWRAPFGETNREVLYWAAQLGYRHIGWSHRCDSWDWVADKNSDLYRSAEEIKNHFLEMDSLKGLSGKIILMHLGSERLDDFPYLSLSELISELKDRGYSFLKVSEFLKR